MMMILLPVLLLLLLIIIINYWGNVRDANADANNDKLNRLDRLEVNKSEDDL